MSPKNIDHVLAQSLDSIADKLEEGQPLEDAVAYAANQNSDYNTEELQVRDIMWGGVSQQVKETGKLQVNPCQGTVSPNVIESVIDSTESNEEVARKLRFLSDLYTP